MSRRLTNIEFRTKYMEKFPNSKIEILGEYINNNIHIHCRCGICKNEWNTTPSTLMRGSNCPKCARKISVEKHKLKPKKTKSHSEFINNLYEKYPNSNVEIIGIYVNAKTKIACKCKTCDNEWFAMPYNLLANGTGCPKCARIKNNIRLAKISYEKKKTSESFQEEYYKKYPNSKVKIIGNYVTANDYIRCKCKACKHIWNSYPSVLLKGSSCPKCSIKIIAKKISKTSEQFKKDFSVKNTNKNIELLEDYVTSRTPIKCRCNICNYEWETLPTILLTGVNCPQCAKMTSAKKHTKTTEQFKEEYYKKFPNSNLKFLSDYVGATKPIKCKCILCNHEWSTIPTSLLSGSSCPKCADSKGNQLLENILTQNHLNHKREYHFKEYKELGKRKFDNSLLNKNNEVEVLFEYDGQQHFKDYSIFGGIKAFKKRVDSDNLKNLFCANSNIPLLRIPYIYDAINDADKIETIILDFIETKKVPKDILDFYKQYDFSNYVNCVEKLKINYKI